MTNEKYALLDTDFISKMHLIRKDNENPMINRIMEMPGYQFYCHEQIHIELSRHNIAGAPEWLCKMKSNGTIICYDDEQILDELENVYGASASAMYMQLLKTACEAYRKGYFEEKFQCIRQLDYRNVTKADFLYNLEVDCDLIGEGQNLGELKTYVLLQVLFIMSGEQIYVFCSDDKNARNGIVSIGGVKCISVLSAFLRLHKEGGFEKEEAAPYVDAYLRLCSKANQRTFKIQDSSKERRLCKVPCEKVLEEIFEGKLEELKTGNLKYIE